MPAQAVHQFKQECSARYIQRRLVKSMETLKPASRHCEPGCSRTLCTGSGLFCLGPPSKLRCHKRVDSFGVPDHRSRACVGVCGRVAYDGTARNACNAGTSKGSLVSLRKPHEQRAQDIIQFLYGEDGMDGLWIEELPISPEAFREFCLASASTGLFRFRTRLWRS